MVRFWLMYLTWFRDGTVLQSVSFLETNLHQTLFLQIFLSSPCMPVDIATVQLLEMTHGLPLTTEFVLYCQSAGCHSSDIIAGELTRLGFHRLRIFRPGMLAWERAGMPCEVRK